MTRHFFALFALVAISASCSDDDSTDPVAEVSGTYMLSTINGAPVPYTISTAPVLQELMSGTLVLNAAGTYTTTSVVRTTTNGTPATTSSSSSGTWTRTNSTINFHNPADGSDTAGTYANGSLTATINGLIFVFHK